MDTKAKEFYNFLRNNGLIDIYDFDAIDTLEINLDNIYEYYNKPLTDSEKHNINNLIIKIGFKPIDSRLYELDSTIEELDQKYEYKATYIDKPAAKRPRIEPQLPINETAGPSGTNNTLSKPNKTQKLFNKLVELGKITEKTVINKDNEDSKVKKKINLSVTYDEALSVHNALNISNTAGTPHYLRLLGFEQDPIPKNTYTIPYNINLKDYIKCYFPFIIAINIPTDNNYQRISLLTQVYTRANEVKDLDTLSAILHTNTKNNRNKARYNKLLEYKNTSGYVYKDTIG
ncbi:hypothetical protein ACFX5K_06195 [Rickettsiales bacterium LUAb2]